MGEMRSAYKVFVRKPERKRPRGSSRHRWGDNIKMAVKSNIVGGCGLALTGAG
jgi:hypothetical protein